MHGALHRRPRGRDRPGFWTLIGEIFPPRARAAGPSASTAVNWLANFIVSLIFLPIAVVIGQGETFRIFAVIAALGWIFVGRFVPETKERDFTQVDADLQSWFGRHSPDRPNQRCAWAGTSRRHAPVVSDQFFPRGAGHLCLGGRLVCLQKVGQSGTPGAVAAIRRHRPGRRPDAAGRRCRSRV